MMKKRVLSIALFTLLVALFLAAATQSRTYAQECQVVRILREKQASGDTIRLNPDALTVKKGDCVVWVNWHVESAARVNFREDAKRCQEATEAPSGFKAAENCFLTEFMGVGRTASLRFVDPGTYTYEIEMPDERRSTAAPYAAIPGIPSAKGQITVQE